MGPHFFKCGNGGRRQSPAQTRQASMGPHFFKCGNCAGQSSACFGHGSFNGAALFQVRKQPAKGSPAGHGDTLQWGRTFSSAETKCDPIEERLEYGGFNGAALFQVRKLGPPIIVAFGSGLLQWGRTFSSAETTHSGLRAGRVALASMGPHFFKCGNACFLRFLWYAIYCFNGAALFQVRKLRHLNYNENSFKCCFNGAALFQVRKLMKRTPSTSITSVASMGPHFFKCGNQSSAAPVKQRGKASMGPHFFKCGNFFFRLRTPPENRASMGPHFFKCGNNGLRALISFPLCLLQWGRTFSSAETRSDAPRPITAGPCFNGAALFQVRKRPSGGRSAHGESPLQWGRTFSSAETPNEEG